MKERVIIWDIGKMQVNMAKNVIIRRHAVFWLCTTLWAAWAEIFTAYSDWIHASMPKMSTKIDTYFRCLSFTLLFLPQLLSRGFGHSNQKHNFGPVKPNSHNKCKILHRRENRIAEELYYKKDEFDFRFRCFYSN